MQFYCKGKTWNTDKYVYVAGYRILKSWFPAMRHKVEAPFSEVKEYGLSCKKAYISSIFFDFNDGVSYVKDFNVCVQSECGSREDLKFSSLEVVGTSIGDVKSELQNKERTR